jgi:transposase
MRTKTFRPYDQDTLLLMPPSVRDWVPADGLAAFINDLVDELDLGPFLAAHDEPRGMPPYHPALMLKVLLYGYATGVRSSRKLEERLGADVNFMFLAGQARPDHKTISSFRRRHLAAFGALFLQVLVLCRRAGLVRLGRVAIDGTKLKANASRHKAMSYARMTEREAELAAQVQAILDEAEAVDAAEDQLYGDARGDELPPELRTREGRLAKIREAKAALEQQARERTGNPDAVPEPKAQRNFTDPASKIMLSKPDGWIQGYTVGAVVDEAHQVIVATDVTAETTDTRTLPALVDQVKDNTGRSPRRLLADAGYASEENFAALEARGIDAYIALGRDRHGAPLPPPPRGRIPASLSRRDRMGRKLRTKAGRAHYARRKAIVEPVFGQIKEARGFRRFSLRGLEQVRAEWLLVAAVHNLGKLFGSGQAGRVVRGRAVGSRWALGGAFA